MTYSDRAYSGGIGRMGVGMGVGVRVGNQGLSQDVLPV